MTNIPKALRILVVERAGNACEYCGLSQVSQEATFHIDHVLPRVANGPTEAENLALACVSCSLRKWALTTAIDPQTGIEVPLFNPRNQNWDHHFEREGILIQPLTAIGRATVWALEFNRPNLLIVRQIEAFRCQGPLG